MTIKNTIPNTPRQDIAQFHQDQLRDSLEHVRGVMGLQDVINVCALEVLMDAVIRDSPKIQDLKTLELIAEAREWAKYDATGASTIVNELCDALEGDHEDSNL